MLATTLETSQQQRPIDAGVLRPLVQSYVDHLAARGYRPATIHSLESRARHFCSWLVHSDIAASSINNDMIEQFARHTCQCSGTSVTFSPNTAYIGMVRKFLAFLIESGTIQQPRCEAVAPSDDRLPVYLDWLKRHRGLTDLTIRSRSKLLNKLLPLLGCDPRSYDAACIRGVIVAESQRHSAGHMKSVVPGASSYLSVPSTWTHTADHDLRWIGSGWKTIGSPVQIRLIGLIPDGWELAAIGAHHSVASGGTPSRGTPAFWSRGTIPWVKTTEVDYCVISETEEHITPQGLESSAAKMLPAGTLLMAMYGQGVTRGKVAILGIEAACNQACAAITPKDDAVLPRYLYHFLTWRYEEIRSLAHGGQQQNLNLEIVRDLPVAHPQTDDEQSEIVAILDALDNKIALHRQKRAVLEELFQSLLHKLMTGAIRVTDLDLPALTQTTETTA